MTDWRIRLREADRALGRDVAPEASQRMRRRVVAAVPATASAGQEWSRAFAATAAITIKRQSANLHFIIVRPVRKPRKHLFNANWIGQV